MACSAKSGSSSRLDNHETAGTQTPSPIARYASLYFGGRAKPSGAPMRRAASRAVRSRMRMRFRSTNTTVWRLDPPTGVRRHPANPSKRTSARCSPFLLRRYRNPILCSPEFIASFIFERCSGAIMPMKRVTSAFEYQLPSSWQIMSVIAGTGADGAGNLGHTQAARNLGGSPATARRRATEAQ